MSHQQQHVMNMADQIHAEVRSMIGQSRLTRNSQGIALVHRCDLHVKELLGRGAFSEVHEVKIIPRTNGSGSSSSSTTATPNTTYAMKHLKARLLSQPENFRLAAAELAIEAHMLASFDHPNVMKIRGWAANGVASFTDGRHDSFFLLLDKLDETLDNRISTWQRMMDQELLIRQSEIENKIRTIQQQQGTHHHHHGNGLTGGLVTDIWRRLNSTNGSNMGGIHHQQQENVDPNHVVLQHQHQQQQQQQQQRQQIVAVQKQQQKLQYDYESLQLEKFGICVEIASALAYLHDSGVIFRDLKPNNIGFLNGRVQLFDFGLSRELPSMNLIEPFEMSGKVGTLRYMAVEVACHSEYNVSADVYSWAMVCYEIFTLQKPFAGWTRDMHSNLVCGRGIRPEFPPNPTVTNGSSTSTTSSSITDPSVAFQIVPPAVKQLLEVSWHQQAYRRPAMRIAEQKMKQLEEQQLFTVCSLDRVNKVNRTSSFHPNGNGRHNIPTPHQGLQLQALHDMRQSLPQHHTNNHTIHHMHAAAAAAAGQHHHHQGPPHQPQQQQQYHHQQQQQNVVVDRVVELPQNFSVDVRKTPNRNYSEPTAITSSTTVMSSDSDIVMAQY